MCKVFDGLLTDKDLCDAAFDCGNCDSCARRQVDIGVNMLVKYQGHEAVVQGFTYAGRYRIQGMESGEVHAVAGSSLSLVSSQFHASPAALVKNKLNKGEKKALIAVLAERFRAYSLQHHCLLSCEPADPVIAKMAKWTSAASAERSPVTLPGVNMQQWFESAQKRKRARR